MVLVISDPSDTSLWDESPRPAKRRRTCIAPEITEPDEAEEVEDEEEEDEEEGEKEEDWEDEAESDSSVNDSDRDHGYGQPEQLPINVVSKKSDTKCRMFEPKYYTNQEPIFVSQVSQPASSPSAIRGPIWKKSSSPEPVMKAPTQPRNEHPNLSEDEDLKLAISESLNSFKEESSARKLNNGLHYRLPAVESSNGVQNIEATGSTGDGGIDLNEFEDLPDDVFDISPTSSPLKSPNNESSLFVSQYLPPRPQQTNLRQTTIFGAIAKNPDTSKQSASQSASRSWPPVNKNEEPTHHELNPEAIKTWIYPANLGSKREYQFNISMRGLFHNVLVALPTGLGKTFIAACIMLNWYRWTKDAQIVFVAPTRPLVSQQIDACYNIAGIPRSETTMLTGNVAPGLRAEEWEKRRVFFMTPQTLINDLKSGYAKPNRIVLLVVDEAHRATGAYVYVGIVKFLERFNSSFRVVALTATPGSTVESVQEVIDGLNISRVEIRTEDSMDIREYIHARKVETKTFSNSDEMNGIMDQLSKALQPLLNQLVSRNAYYSKDPMSLTPFGLTEARAKWANSEAVKAMNWGEKGMIMSIFSLLASLAHAIELLKYHGMGPFFRNLSAFQADVTEKGSKGGKYARQVAENANFKTMMNTLRPRVISNDFVGHPKLEYLKQIVLNHFLDADTGGDSGSGKSTRVMIFSHFRDSAEEIVKVLKQHSPMVLPHVFVGQASAKGSEGMDQKKQLDIIKKFKEGTYNTIVATSIGEEGLDIGEVDLIVCYDSSASPIRMLQRMGRTGRKRSGKVILLLMEGKEEDKYTRAKDNYETMQQLIASGSRFTFHDDKSPRIIPREVQPVVDERVIEIPPENTQAALPVPTKRGRPPKRPPKKFHMPDNVETGFTNASKLGRKRKAPDTTLEEDDDDRTKRYTSPPPELAEIPPLEEILLTPSQQEELVKFRTVAGDSPQFIGVPRNDAYPTEQRSYRPTRTVRHGQFTRSVVKTLRRMRKFSIGYVKDYSKYLPSDFEEGDQDEFCKRFNAPSPVPDPSSLETKRTPSRGTQRPVNRGTKKASTTGSANAATKTTSYSSLLSSDDEDDFPSLDMLFASQDHSTSKERRKSSTDSDDEQGIPSSKKQKQSIIIGDESDDSDFGV